MPTYIIEVETEEPVPYTWTLRIEAADEDEAKELAAVIDGVVLDAMIILGRQADIDGEERIVHRVTIARQAADDCTCELTETCDACIDAGVLDS